MALMRRCEARRGNRWRTPWKKQRMSLASLSIPPAHAPHVGICRGDHLTVAGSEAHAGMWCTGMSTFRGKRAHANAPRTIVPNRPPDRARSQRRSRATKNARRLLPHDCRCSCPPTHPIASSSADSALSDPVGTPAPVQLPIQVRPQLRPTATRTANPGRT